EADGSGHPRGGGQLEGLEPCAGEPLDGATQMTVETAAPTIATAPAAPIDTRMASLRAIYIIWYRDILRYWRDRWRLVASLAQPLLFLVVFGSGLSSSLGGAFGRGTGISYIQFMYPGIIGMSILLSAIFGAMSIVWDREFGFLKIGRATSELQSRGHLVCRLLLEKKK